MKRSTHRTSSGLTTFVGNWRWVLLAVASLLILASCRADKGGNGPPADLTDTEQSEVLEDSTTVDAVDTEPGDVTDTDAEADTPPDTLAPVPVPAGSGITSGGGVVRSSRFQLHLAVGGPSPASDVAGTRFKARVGVAVPQLP